MPESLVLFDDQDYTLNMRAGLETRKNSLHFGADPNNWDGPQIFLMSPLIMQELLNIVTNFLSNNSRILINSGHILRSGIYVFWTLLFESKSQCFCC